LYIREGGSNAFKKQKNERTQFFDSKKGDSKKERMQKLRGVVRLVIRTGSGSKQDNKKDKTNQKRREGTLSLKQYRSDAILGRALGTKDR